MEVQGSRQGTVGGASPLGIATINPPEFANLAACTEDVRQAGIDGDAGPSDPLNFPHLRGRLEAVRHNLPPLYEAGFVSPYIATLDRIGQAGFAQILVRDPNHTRTAGLMVDIAHAILQQGESFAAQATDAFQEVVSDLYDGFLSAEDRKGVNPPDKGTVPPLVKWGNPNFGPYTWPVDATEIFGVEAAVVSLPPTHIRRGLLAWAALGHETAGHDILNADTNLRQELAAAVQQSLAGLDGGLAEYWSARIDETASDVLGILNMGPAAGIGLIGYFRGLNAAFGGPSKLRNEGFGADPHPADIVRGYLAAETVRQLRFTGKTHWANAIVRETDKDLEAIVLDGTEIDKTRAHRSAALVAKTLVTFRAPSLEGHALGEIQNWRDSDGRRIRRVRRALRTAVPLSETDLTEIYAAHVVAAAVVEALALGADIDLIFRRMLVLLKAMHAANPSWGPLFVRSPGNLGRHIAYIPTPPESQDDGLTNGNGGMLGSSTGARKRRESSSPKGKASRAYS